MGSKILAPAVGLVLLASLAKGGRTNGRTNISLYVYRCAFDPPIFPTIATLFF